MKSQQSSVDCIVPFFNEGSRLRQTIDFLIKVKGISKIICVNDGSTTLFYFPSHHRVVLVNLPQNLGKTMAIKEGLQHVKSQSVLLFDADLHDYHQQDLESAIALFLNKTDIDMLILRRSNDPWINRLIRTDIVLSGQRLLRLSDLKAISAKPVKRFQFELSVNDYMLAQFKACLWAPFHCRDIYKTKKYGFLPGLLGEFKMYHDLISYRGFRWYFNHLLTFCSKKLE